MRLTLLITTTLFLFSINSFAKDKKINPERFNERKSIITSHLDKRISMLTEKKSCISSAATRSAIKDCNKGFKEKGKQLKADRKEKFAGLKTKYKKNKK